MMTDAESPRGPQSANGALTTLRACLEVVALFMIVAVCGAMLIALVRGSRSGVPAPPSTGRAAVRRAPDPPLPTEPISLDGAHLQGSRAAKIAVVEYSDFQCPYCGRFARETLPDIERTYVEPGKVLYAFRQYPLESIHPFALKAAEAAECAGEQGQFWRMHDLNFADQTHLDEPKLRERAKTVGLNAEQFDRCLRGDVAERVHADARTGTAFAVTGTPTFFVGVPQGDGRIKVVKRLSGALSFAEFSAILDAMGGPGAAEPRAK